MRPLRAPTLLAIATLLAACGPEAPPSSGGTAAAPSTLIRNARIVDGTGAPERPGSVRIADGRIVAVGDLAPESGESVVDATGLVLTPGFIDTHSHHDRGLFEQPEALAAVSQGITTIVVGQDGGSPSPLADFFGRLDAEPVAVNVASYSGHNTHRAQVLGDDFRRVADADEVGRMVELLASDMEAGALGLATGLEYDPGLYSDREELLALASEAARWGGRYISHMRSEDQHFWDALGELIDVGRSTDMPVQVSHMKLAMKGLWGQAAEALAILDQARAEGIDVTADVYPYTYWQSTMTVIFPDRNFEDRAAFEFALREVVPPEGLRLTRYAPDPTYVGMTLLEIAAARSEDPVDTYMHLVRESQEMAERTGTGTESVLGTSMHPDDVRTLLQWPHTNVSSDGALNGGHPRGFGAFPRFLGRLGARGPGHDSRGGRAQDDGPRGRARRSRGGGYPGRRATRRSRALRSDDGAGSGHAGRAAPHVDGDHAGVGEWNRGVRCFRDHGCAARSGAPKGGWRWRMSR